MTEKTTKPKLPASGIKSKVTGFFKKIKTKFSTLSSNYKMLPIGTKRLMSLGMVLSFVFVLPILVLTLMSTTTHFFNRAASGEITGEPPPTHRPTATPWPHTPPPNPSSTPVVTSTPKPTHSSTPTPIVYPTPTSTPIVSAVPTPGPHCRERRQTVRLLPNSQDAYPTQPLEYTVHITNNNTADCPPATFWVTPFTTYSNGWLAFPAGYSVSIESGKTSVSSVLFVSPESVKRRRYSVRVSVTGQRTINASAIYRVTTLNIPTSTPVLVSTPAPIPVCQFYFLGTCWLY